MRSEEGTQVELRSVHPRTSQCTHSGPRIDVTIDVENRKHVEVQVPEKPAYPQVIFIVL